MRSYVKDIMSIQVRRSLKKFGSDLSIARRRRRLTVSMMCERLGVSKSTWQRMEKGDPSVAMGAYAQALFVLGSGTPWDDLLDARNDEQGLIFDEERLPKRVVPPRGRREDR